MTADEERLNAEVAEETFVYLFSLRFSAPRRTLRLLFLIFVPFCVFRGYLPSLSRTKNAGLIGGAALLVLLWNRFD